MRLPAFTHFSFIPFPKLIEFMLSTVSFRKSSCFFFKGGGKVCFLTVTSYLTVSTYVNNSWHAQTKHTVTLKERVCTNIICVLRCTSLLLPQWELETWALWISPSHVSDFHQHTHTNPAYEESLALVRFKTILCLIFLLLPRRMRQKKNGKRKEER